MKKLVLLFAAILMMVGFTTKVMAQTNTDATVTGTEAGAVLFTAMTLTETSSLHFGCMTLITSVGGTCVLNTANERTFSLVANLNESASQTPPSKNAAYDVTGTAGQTYALVLPVTTTITAISPATGTMNITDMTVKFAAGSEVPWTSGLSSTLDASGEDSFIVGGKLTVGASQVGGVYAGTFDVTVDYN